jgi:ATP-dependent helicase/nuclease subunit A
LLLRDPLTTGDYVRAFERRNIPHLLVGSKSLHGREEVGVIRKALLAIEWPRDEFSVYATIRGPMFGVKVICSRRRLSALPLT